MATVISLRKSIDAIEESEQRYARAVESYLALVTGLEEHPVAVHPDLVLRFREKLKENRRALNLQPSPAELRQSQIALHRELRDYADECAGVLERRDSEVREILETLADAVGTLTAQNQVHNSKLGEFTKRLETASRLTSLSEIRQRLVSQVGELKTFMHAVHEEKEASISELRTELHSFQLRLEQAEKLAFSDAVTGIANRAEGDRRLNEAIESGQRFSILLFDLNDFKQVNDRYGHQAGDLVLQLFARRLVQNTRPGDIVCRWGGDEFLVILAGCNLDNALHRARMLSNACSGQYALRCNEGEVTVPVRAAVGAAEFIPGEPRDQLFSRADRFLYREKEVPTLS